MFPYLAEIRLLFKLPGALFQFWRDYCSYRKLAHLDTRYPLKVINFQPELFARYDSAGSTPRHYFYQDIWAARKVFQSKVNAHYDIGSRIDGFVAHCAVFCKVTLFDIRPMQLHEPNIQFVQCDATQMDHVASGSIASLSSLHAIDNFGTGHYGGPIDPLAYQKVIREMQRVVKSKGHIYLSVPIGQGRVEFNDGHVFDPNHIVELFDQCILKDFSGLDDADALHEKIKPAFFKDGIHCCGFYHFIKK